MSYGTLWSRATLRLGIVTALSLAGSAWLNAQAVPAARQPSTPPTPKAAAPLDLTGYWVSVVTEDWRFRMMTPDKGDFSSVPLNPEGHRVANTWNSEKDEADGDQCKSYGAAAIMRVPGRVHIFWEGDNTLRLDTDAGAQTRLLHFEEQASLENVPAKAPTSEASTWQGYSVASWEGQKPRNPQAGPGQALEGQAKEGYLKVLTNHMRPGYLRKNGVPYSANATLEEYFESFTEPNGDKWLIVTTIVTDPQYLLQPFITSTNFKRLPDASGWNPSKCEVK
jgi:hypothetical protein